MLDFHSTFVSGRKMNRNAADYQVKLKDPRWQRTRLKMFERDNWRCTKCGNPNRTLHLHHTAYTAADPWNEAAENLVTVCVDCHAAEHGLPDEFDSAPGVLDTRPETAKPIAEMLVKGIGDIQDLYERGGGITGISTGLPEFDKMIDGLHPGELIVIASRPSVGKTAFGMNIAERIAVDQKLPAVVFSLEMSSQQLVQRLLCSRAKVNLGRVREGFLSERDFPALAKAAQELVAAPLFIDDQSALTLYELSRRLRYFVSKEGVKAAVIDYLQLLRSPSRRGRDNRQIEIAEVSAGIKALAKDLQIPIIVLAQLNRNPDLRSEGKGRPRLSDLRESGAIEQDADLVGLLVREEYYAENDEEREESKGKATLIIAKHRNGPVGDVPLMFLKEFTRFESRPIEESDY